MTWHESGMSARAIARNLERSPHTILKVISRKDDEPLPERRGRKRKTTSMEDRMIVREVKRNRFTNAPIIRRELQFEHLSARTVQRRISESGEFASYWAAQKPFISKKNRVARLKWAKDHLHWTLDQWSRVMWSDESPYVLRFHGKVRVWRMCNERYNPKCCVGTVKHDDKIMVWGGFAAHGVGILHRINGIMNKEVYNELLENVMIPNADILFGQENYIFQQDNDPKHTAHINRDFLVDNQVPTLDWPA